MYKVSAMVQNQRNPSSQYKIYKPNNRNIVYKSPTLGKNPQTRAITTNSKPYFELNKYFT
uniref:Uncharacterized protein n=1 Tax=Arion vulgaris TaxID=1028688 RepID=A0A0B6XYX3_9EUPU